MTVRELIDVSEHFPVGRRMVFAGDGLGHDDRSPTQNSTVGFGTGPGVHLRDGEHGDHNERLVVVKDDLAADDDPIRRRVANL